ERRVANVVCQTGGLNDIAQICRVDMGWQQALLRQSLTNLNAQRATDAGHLQRMGQAIVHVVVGGQRMYLSLSRQSPERAGKNNLVVVTQKGSAAGLVLGATLTESTFIQQCCPIHFFSAFRTLSDVFRKHSQA